MLVQSQQAYILHKRPFRDSSQILELFTRQHGRIAVLSKGSRSAKSKTSGLLQLCRPLILSWRGRGELPLLSAVDTAESRAPRLQGRKLMSALYINELMMYLLHRHDTNEYLFDCYHECLYALQQHEIEPVLRLFEKTLLENLGFALNLECDADSGEKLEEGLDYAYILEHGPVSTGRGGLNRKAPVVSGSSLLAYADNRLDSDEKLKEIKMLNRYVLDHLLGHRKLRSRELFRRPSIR